MRKKYIIQKMRITAAAFTCFPEDEFTEHAQVEGAYGKIGGSHWDDKKYFRATNRVDSGCIERYDKMIANLKEQLQNIIRRKENLLTGAFKRGTRIK